MKKTSTSSHPAKEPQNLVESINAISVHHKEEERIMENQITCPSCHIKISDKPIIDDAAKGIGSDTQFLICECGERITYWQITAQLREQKTFWTKILKWFRGSSKG
ncbi:hypothetical protein FBQ99_08735 [Chloroflexi bacterium CFX2]|nr:hypothetical protein [Chloroflexi bacterium CFX2]